jgi:TP901 family phage tail tape measure protein
MAVVGELLVLIAGNNALLTSSIAKSEAELRGFGATANTHGGIAAGAFRAVGLAAVAMGAVTAVGTAIAVKAAGDFQEQMAIINTIAHQTPEELTRTGEAIRAMAVSTGTPLSDMTKAFYDLLSAGIPASQAMDVLRQSTTLSIGALSTVDQAVDLLTTAINSYGLNAKGAAVATDQFALAVQDGKVTADQIAATFSDIAPLAKTAGIGIDEIAATYAVLTARGVPAAEAMTQMNRVMVELMKPNAALRDLQDKLGVSFAKVAADKGLVVALQEMRDAAAANGVPFTDLFGRLEGMKFALATTGPFFATYEAELTKMHGANGTAAEQAAERMGTFSRQVAILGTSFNDLLITVGTPLLPFFTTLVSNISGAVNAMAAWASSMPNLGAALTDIGSRIVNAFGDAVASVAPALGDFASQVLTWIVAQAPIWAAQALSWGEAFVGWITPMIGQAVGMLGDLAGQVGNWIASQAPAWAAQLVAWGQAFVAWVSPMIGQAIAALGAFAGQVASWIVAQIPRWIAQLGQWAGAFIDWVAPMIPGALAALGQFAGRIVDWIAAQLPIWFAALLRWVDAFVAWVVPMIPKVIAALALLGLQIVGWIVGRIPAVALALAGLAVEFVKWVAPKIPGLIGELGKLLVSVLGWMAGVPAQLFAAALNWGKAIFNGILTGIGDIAQAITDAIAGSRGVQMGHLHGAVAAGGGGGAGARSYAEGGVVPGSGAMLAVVHGGETITPAGQAGGTVTHVTHMHLHIDGREIAEIIDERLFRAASGFSSGFTAGNPVTGA